MKKLILCSLALIFLLSLPVFSAETRIQPVNIEQLTWSKPVKVKEFSKDDTRESILTMVCWSPDEGQLFIQGNNPEKSQLTIRLLINADGTGLEEVKRPPSWVATAWHYKTSLESPDTDEKIEEKTEKKTMSVGQGSRGLGGQILGTINIYRYRMHGKNLFEKKEIPIFPGECHSWAPRGGQALVFTDKKGNLHVMSTDGKKDEKIGKGDLCFPCWSPSGNQVLAVKAEKGGKKWTLYTWKLEGIEAASEPPAQ